MLLLADDAAAGPGVVTSASDLTAAVTCEYAVLRALDGMLGRTPPPALERDALTDRLAELGDRHERQVLAGLRRRYGPWDPTTRRGVLEIARPARTDGRDPAVLAAKRDETRASRVAKTVVAAAEGRWPPR